MKRLNDKAYDKKRKKELNTQFNVGKLDSDMIPYLNWLNGEEHTDRIPGSQKTVYYQARRKVNQYLKDNLKKDLVSRFKTYPPLIDRLRNKQFNKVPFSKAEEIAKELPAA